jgi:O-methyltransferase
MRGINQRLLQARYSAATRLRASVARLATKIARSMLAINVEEAARRTMEELVLERFYAEDVGRQYGLDRRAKEQLVESIKRNTQEIPCATYWVSHVVLVHEIINTPPEMVGDVVECGTWKGASSASLSLACRAVGRKLIVCDSFEGLPEDLPDAAHQYPHLSVYGYYKKGMYAGRLDEVKANIERFGDLSVCQFVPGYFSESLTALRDPIVFAFLDVDLLSSLQDCLRHVWPLLVEGGAVYTDDSCDMEVVRIWFDEEWWQQELGEHPPGYVGSGCGLPLNPDHTPLGYTRKMRAPQQSYKRVPWLYYPDASPQGPYFPSEERPS